MKQVIVIAAIKGTKNPLVKQLMLRTEIEKPAESNPVSFFLKGVPKVTPNAETRVFFQSVSTEHIAQFGIVEGSIFHDVYKQFPNARIAVKESFVQKTWMNPDGTTGEQQPKINPTTKQVMTKDGRPIYRNHVLSLDGKEEDVYISHDAVQASTSNPSAGISKPTSIADLATSGKTLVEEPELP